MNRCVFVLMFCCCVWCDELNSFYDWMDRSGFVYYGVEIKSFDGYGLGVSARMDINYGEVVMCLPREKMLTIDFFKNYATLKPVFAESFSPTDLGAITLLYERNRKNSPWGDYIGIFPKEFDSTIYWNQEELEVLQGSIVVNFTVARKNRIEDSYKEIFTDFLLAKFPRIFKAELYTLEDWYWALSIIWSRGFALPDLDSAGLVPLADLFNAPDPGADAQIIPVFNETHFTYFAATNIAAGEQIFTEYGMSKSLSNGQYLMDYGFTFEKNPHDNLFIEIDVSPEDPLYDEKSDLLEQAKILEIHLPVTIGEYPADILTVLRVKYMNEEEFKDTSNHERIINRQPINDRNELEVLIALEELSSDLFSKYSATTIKEDIETLKTPAILTPRELHAIRIRTKEKKILYTLQKVSKGQRKKLESQHIDL